MKIFKILFLTFHLTLFIDESGNPTHPGTAMDEEETINEAFNHRAVTIGQS